MIFHHFKRKKYSSELAAKSIFKANCALSCCLLVLNTYVLLSDHLFVCHLVSSSSYSLFLGFLKQQKLYKRVN
jgi:hypothetical protein